MSYLPDSSLEGGAKVAERLAVMNHDAPAPALTLVAAMRAVQALAPGETFAPVLLSGDANGAGSLRAIVTRRFEHGYSAKLEEWDHVMEQWDAFTHGPAGELGQDDHYIDDLAGVSAVLGYYVHLAASFGRATQAGPADNPALTAILALEEGGSWAETLFDGSPFRFGGAVHPSLRLCVDRAENGYGISFEIGYPNGGWQDPEEGDGLPESILLESTEEVAAALPGYRLIARAYARRIEADAAQEASKGDDSPDLRRAA